jgi:hypothetical protein
MPKLPLPLNLPLRVRGIKGVTFMGIMLLLACPALIAFLITPLSPLNLKRGNPPSLLSFDLAQDRPRQR